MSHISRDGEGDQLSPIKEVVEILIMGPVYGASSLVLAIQNGMDAKVILAQLG